MKKKMTVFGRELEKAGISAADFAHFIRRNERTVRRWAMGKRPVPHYAYNALRNFKAR